MSRSPVLLLMIVSLALPWNHANCDETPPNPYGVAGWGRLGTLGMPADCIDYDWNVLRPGNLAQMCRTNHYYNYIGIATRYWGWNEVTEQINDPDRFADWIADNPGRVWIIGNEPDLNSQDGISREQYARMYRTYHEFIGSRDPTARFCIGGITGGSTQAAFQHSRAWYEHVLNYYKATYGEAMPIDIWNIHSYCGPRQIEDPDQPIRDFVTPFVDWCHTVDDARYAGAEVWITELPIGEWMGALDVNWTIWFAQRYLPRLERAGISRWFWFVSSAGSEAEWESVSLVTGGVPTAIGQAYAALAHGYPNEIIPVSPYVPDPTPLVFTDDFSGGSLEHPWTVKAGKWVLEDGGLRQNRVGYQWNGETCVLQYVYDDLYLDLRMKVNQVTDPVNWAGVLFRVAGRFDWHADSGYLLFMRDNGAIGLFNRHDGIMQAADNAVSDPGQWQDIRIHVTGWRIRVWLNDEPLLDVVDANQRYASGFLALQVQKADAGFADFRISTRPPLASLQLH